MTDVIRAFIAFELPNIVLAAIGKVQARFQPYRFNVRWVKTGNIHLTLKFLGNIKSDDIDKIHRAMAVAAKNCGPISLAAGGVGVFPGTKKPRVIWVGISDEKHQLTGLQKSIDDHLVEIGFARENRPFKGHLTLGRVKGRIDSRRLATAVEESGSFEPIAFTVDRIILYRSELKPAGPIYTRLKSVEMLL